MAKMGKHVTYGQAFLNSSPLENKINKIELQQTLQPPTNQHV